MRAPFELDCRPLRSRSTPAFISSSLYLAMALSSASLGMTPASDSLLALTIIMNFMVHLSFDFLLGTWNEPAKSLAQERSLNSHAMVTLATVWSAGQNNNICSEHRGNCWWAEASGYRACDAVIARDGRSTMVSLATESRQLES